MLTGSFRPAVDALFMRGGPSTVVWRVVTIVINAVNGFAGGLVAHVRKEIGKILPAFANAYASCSVPFIRRVVRVFASLAYAPPDIVSRWLLSLSSLVAVLGIRLSRSLIAQAPARLRISVSDRININRLFDSALAANKPFSARIVLENRQATVDASCMIFSHAVTIPHFFTRWKWF